MANVTTTTIAVTIATLISKEIFLELENKPHMANLVFRRNAPRGVGTIKFPQIAKLTAVDKTSGTALTPASNTETALTLLLDKHKAVAMEIDDIAELQSSLELRKIYVSRMAEALATVLDTDLFALYSALSQTIGTGTASITDANIREAIQYLDEANAPAERYLVIPPSQKNAILGIDKFVLAYESGDSTLKTGEIGQIYGVKVIVSNNCPVVTTTVKCLMFSRDAFGLGVQQNIRVKSAWNVLGVAEDIVADMVYGVCELRDDFAVVIDCLN